MSPCTTHSPCSRLSVCRCPQPQCMCVCMCVCCVCVVCVLCVYGGETCSWRCGHRKTSGDTGKLTYSGHFPVAELGGSESVSIHIDTHIHTHRHTHPHTHTQTPHTIHTSLIPHPLLAARYIPRRKHACVSVYVCVYVCVWVHEQPGALHASTTQRLQRLAQPLIHPSAPTRRCTHSVCHKKLLHTPVQLLPSRTSQRFSLLCSHKTPPSPPSQNRSEVLDILASSQREPLSLPSVDSLRVNVHAKERQCDASAHARCRVLGRS